jgi:DNA-binding response OmpR family regulator
MKIHTHEHEDKINLELTENEFTLLAYLIEKSSTQTRQDNFIKNPIDVSMNEVFRKYLEDN